MRIPNKMKKFTVTGKAWTTIEFTGVEAFSKDDAMLQVENELHGLCWHCGDIYEMEEADLEAIEEC